MTLHPSQDQPSATQNEHGSAKHDQLPNSSLPLASVEVHASPTGTNDERAHRERSHALEQKKYVVERLTLIFLILYTGVTTYNACLTKTIIRDSDDSFKKTLAEMQKQTTAQEGSMTAMRDALALEQGNGVRTEEGIPRTRANQSGN